MKRGKHCKDVSIMSPQDEQYEDKDKFILFVYGNFLVLLCMQTKNKQTKCEHSRRNSDRLQLSQ